MRHRLGAAHTCAVDLSGELSCWGWNGYGQLDAPAGDHYASVAAGMSFSCALTRAGELSCWGRNDAGQLDAPTGQFEQVSLGAGARLRVEPSRRAVLLGPRRRAPDSDVRGALQLSRRRLEPHLRSPRDG